MTKPTTTSPATAIGAALAKCTIKHPQFGDAMSTCELILERHTLGLAPSGAFIYGEPGVGKSRLATSFMQRAVSQHGKNAGKILFFPLTGTTTLSHVYSDMLKALGDPRFNNGTIPDKLNRIIEGLKARQAEVVMFDEMHHLFTAKLAGPKLLMDIANALKALMDTARVSILIFGIPDVLTLWKYDQQIRRRFNAPIQLKFFQYPEDRAVWTAIMRDLLQVVKEHGVTYDLTLQSFSDRIHLASKGSLAIAVRILSDGVLIALREGRMAVSQKDLSMATKVIVSEEDGNPAAFDLSPAMLATACRCNSDTPSPAPRDPDASDLLAKK